MKQHRAYGVWLIVFLLFISYFLLSGCSGGGGGGGSAPPPNSSSSSGGGPIPTPDPTTSPTESPTQSPTVSPTESPTTSPTQSPTETTGSPTPTQTTGVGILQISSTPSGATIWIDGTNLGTTPFDITVTARNHTVSLRLSGYEWWEQSVSVSSSETVPVNATLVAFNTYIPQTQVWEKQVYQAGGISYNSSNSLIYVIGYYYGNVVEAFDTAGNFQFRFSTGTSGTPWGVICNGNKIYVSVDNSIRVFDTSGNPDGTFGQGNLSWARGLKIKNQKLYCCDTDDKIEIFDLDTRNLISNFGYAGGSLPGEGPLENPAWIEVTDDKIFVIDESHYIRVFNFNGIHQYSTDWNFQQGGITEIDQGYVLFLDPGSDFFVKMYQQNGQIVNRISSTIFSKFSDICRGEQDVNSGKFFYYVTDKENNKIRKIY